MKQRTFVWLVLSFLLGMGVAYGLIVLDEKASIPRLERTDIFEVVDSDGTLHRLSYAEIEREREELRAWHGREDAAPRLEAKARRPVKVPGGEIPDLPVPGSPAAEATAKGPPKQELRKIFAKIFSQPIMKDLMEAQVVREAGELADVLDLTDPQLTSVEQELRKRKRALPAGLAGPSSGADEEEPEISLEEALQGILTAEQFERYREYTEQKKNLTGSPPLERQVFELRWRLQLSEEQEGPVREILSEQEARMGQTSPASTLEPGASPGERLEKHLEMRTALHKETADKMKPVLDEDQYEAFLSYQVERDTETRLLKGLIQQEQGGEPPPTP